MDREAWRAVIHGVAKSRTQLSDWTKLNWTEDTIGLTGWLSIKESACDAKDAGDGAGLIPGSGRSPGERKGYPFQYSCLGKSHGQRSLLGYSVATESDTTEATEQDTQYDFSLEFSFYKQQQGNSQTLINLLGRKSVSFLCPSFRISVYYKSCWKTSHTASWSMWHVIHHTEWSRTESTLLGLLRPSTMGISMVFRHSNKHICLKTNTYVGKQFSRALAFSAALGWNSESSCLETERVVPSSELFIASIKWTKESQKEALGFSCCNGLLDFPLTHTHWFQLHFEDT